jgi:glycosyltransferase involved in cell wall biosynthesis
MPFMDTTRMLIMNWRDLKNPAAGGAELFTHEVAKRLEKRGYDVTIFSSWFHGSLREEIIEDVRIVRNGGRYTVYRRAKDFYLQHKDEFDLVIDEVNTRPFFASQYVKNKAVIALIHQLAKEYWFYETPFPICYAGYFLEKHWLSKYVDIPTITISESTKNDLMKFGFTNVHMVTQGLSVKPLERVPEKADKPTMLFVGRLRKAKFPDHAIKAFNIIKRKIPSAQLWVVGDGYLRKKLERNCREGVVFFGRVSDNLKFELMKKAHLLLVPSIREGWGLVITEANACGTPAVAYNVPGLKDAVRNMETGVLVPFNDINGLVNSSMNLLTAEKPRLRMSENALRWAGRFCWDKTAEEVDNAIKSVMSMNNANSF